MECENCPQLIRKSVFSATRRCRIKNIELIKVSGCNIDGYLIDNDGIHRTWVGKPKWVLRREAEGEDVIHFPNEAEET